MNTFEKIMGKIFSTHLSINNLFYPFVVVYSIIVYSIYPLDKMPNINNMDYLTLGGLLLFGMLVAASLIDVKENR